MAARKKAKDDEVRPAWRKGAEVEREPYLRDGVPPGPGRILARSFDLPDEGIPPGVLDDRELVGCRLGHGWSTEGVNAESPETVAWVQARPAVRRLHLRQTLLGVCRVTGLVFEDCVFEGLRVPKPFAWIDCGFHRVTLRGFVGAMDVASRGKPGDPPAVQGVRGALRAFYDDVDWALDIREADLSELSITGIPVDKIRRNPELHAILRRENADVKAFLKVREASFTWFPNEASNLALSDEPACLLMAHPRSKSFDLDRKALVALRRAGLVE